MNDKINQDTINKALWAACDTFRVLPPEFVKKTSQIEVKLTVWTMSGKPNGQYGT